MVVHGTKYEMKMSGVSSDDIKNLAVMTAVMNMIGNTRNMNILYTVVIIIIIIITITTVVMDMEEEEEEVLYLMVMVIVDHDQVRQMCHII